MTPGQNVWCGAVRDNKLRQVTSIIAKGSAQEVVLNKAQLKVHAPAGSKMLVCGIEFLRIWRALYNASPTDWTVDYHNQVLVASGVLKVQDPFFAGQYYPHYSQRLRHWSTGVDDPKLVPLAAPLTVNPVVVTALYDYKAEGGGYMDVHVGDRIRLFRSEFQPGGEDDVYSVYAYGYRLHPGKPLSELTQGWFPIEILHDVQTQLEIVGAQFV